MKRILFVLMVIMLFAVSSEAAIELTEYSVDASGWTVYEPVTSTQSLGQIFATVDNNFIEKVSFYFKNTKTADGADTTAAAFSNRNMCFTLYQDTSATIILKQDTFQVSLDTGAGAYKYYDFPAPINKNKHYYLEITTNSADTNCRIRISNAAGYYRGYGVIGRSYSAWGWYNVKGLYFKIYTNRATETSLENFPDTPVLTHVINTVPVTVDSPVVTTLSETAVNIPDPVTVIQQDSSVRIPDGVTATLSDTAVNIPESVTVIFSDSSVNIVGSVTIDSPIVIAGPVDVNNGNTDVSVANFDDMPDTLDIGNFPASFGASITDTPPVLAKQDASDTYRTEAKIVNFPDMPDTFDVGNFPSGFNINNAPTVTLSDTGVTISEIVDVNLPDSRVVSQQGAGETYQVSIGNTPLPAGENKIGDVGIDDVFADSGALLVKDLDDYLLKQGLMFMFDTCTFLQIGSGDAWVSTLQTGAKQIIVQLTFFSQNNSFWIVSDSPTYNSLGATVPVVNMDFSSGNTAAATYTSGDSMVANGTIKLQQMLGQQNTSNVFVTPWMKWDSNKYYGIYVENDGGNPAKYALRIKFYEL